MFFDKLLIQILMVLFPILMYHAILKFKVHSNFNKNIAFGLLSCLSITFLLIFHLQIGEGKIIDLRYVPWYLSFIYGGFNVGIIVTLFFILVRGIIGGVGMYPAFAMLVGFLPIVITISRHYNDLTYKKKVVYSVLILCSCSTLLTIIGTLFTPNEFLTVKKFWTYVLYVSAHGITVWLAIYLEESIRGQDLLQQEFQKTEKMHVVGQLAASVAHEIRNPMTSVRGFLQLLEGSNNLSATEKTYVKVSIDELDRSHYIIKDYLTLAKEEVTSSLDNEINLNEEVCYVVKTMSSFATIQNIELIHEIKSDEEPLVFGNKHKVQQLLVNLIKNAIEASKGSSKVIIETEHDKKGNVILKVIDFGLGMTKQQLERIGLPFYSTKEKGTGLGMMVCYKIIRSMNAEINVQSKVNEGTIVTIQFPGNKESKLRRRSN